MSVCSAKPRGKPFADGASPPSIGRYLRFAFVTGLPGSPSWRRDCPGIGQLREPGSFRTSPLLLMYLPERQARGLRNDIEHSVRRFAWQRQAMQSFPSADSHCGSIVFGRLLDPFPLRALRLLNLLTHNPRGVACWRIGVIRRRRQMRAETPRVRRHMIYLSRGGRAREAGRPEGPE
jgi:hypothetical protein